MTTWPPPGWWSLGVLTTQSDCGTLSVEPVSEPWRVTRSWFAALGGEKFSFCKSKPICTILNIFFRFDSKRIVSGAYDGKIKVWDLQAAMDPRSETQLCFLPPASLMSFHCCHLPSYRFWLSCAQGAGGHVVHPHLDRAQRESLQAPVWRVPDCLQQVLHFDQARKQIVELQSCL